MTTCGGATSGLGVKTLQNVA